MISRPSSGLMMPHFFVQNNLSLCCENLSLSILWLHARKRTCYLERGQTELLYGKVVHIQDSCVLKYCHIHQLASEDAFLLQIYNVTDCPFDD